MKNRHLSLCTLRQRSTASDPATQQDWGQCHALHPLRIKKQVSQTAGHRAADAHGGSMETFQGRLCYQMCLVLSVLFVPPPSRQCATPHSSSDHKERETASGMSARCKYARMNPSVCSNLQSEALLRLGESTPTASHTRRLGQIANLNYAQTTTAVDQSLSRRLCQVTRDFIHGTLKKKEYQAECFIPRAYSKNHIALQNTRTSALGCDALIGHSMKGKPLT